MNTRCVIGIGCDDHGDQIAGLLVARTVAEQSNGAITAVESSGAPQHLVRSWCGCDTVVVVEAMPGDQPGAVHHSVPHPRRPRVGDSSARLSTRLREALALGPLPDRVTVVTIEGQCFAPNAPATPAVACAASQVAARIMSRVAVPLRVPTGRIPVVSRTSATLVGA